jgi:hypothetical protein
MHEVIEQRIFDLFYSLADKTVPRLMGGHIGRREAAPRCRRVSRADVPVATMWVNSWSCRQRCLFSMSSAVVTEGAAVLVEIWGSAQRREEERTTADLDMVSNICEEMDVWGMGYELLGVVWGIALVF